MSEKNGAAVDGLAAAIRKVLREADLVLGWVDSPASGTAVPARFYSAADAGNAVFDSTCVHNLAVYLPNLRDRTVGIVAKGCDNRSIVELIVEGRVDRERVRVISVPCPGVVDVKKVWRCFGFGKKLIDTGGMVAMEQKTAPREEILMAKCRGCRDLLPVIHDELVGDPAAATAAPEAPPAGLTQRFASLNPAERGRFWREQFARCVRCYACRDVCPMCFCRDVCAMQTRNPHWVGGEATASQSQMAQLVRISHMAGRCTGCGECERACPVGIPLMLLLNEQNRVIEEMFGYRAGTDLRAKPPLLTFDPEGDSWEGETREGEAG